VRTVRREEAWLSHSYHRDTLVISVSGQPGTDYEPYLREVHAVLGSSTPACTGARSTT
jgi:hypothetical protein